jgi:NTE family protein
MRVIWRSKSTHIDLQLHSSHISGDVVKIKNLSFKGGGPKAIPYVGALEILHEKNILAGIEKVAGASAGAIMAVLLACNYSVSEIREILFNSDFGEFQDTPLSALQLPIKSNPVGHIQGMWQNPAAALPQLLADIDWQKIAAFNPNSFSLQDTKDKMSEELTQVYQRAGICKGEKFTEWLKNLFRKKNLDSEMSFAQLHELVLKSPHTKESRFRDLAVVGVNLDRGQAEIFNAINTPNMKVIEAIRISMSIPIAFQAPQKEGETFTDGGVLSNDPVEFDDKDGIINPNTLSFRVDTQKEIDFYQDGKAKPKSHQNSPYIVKLAKTLLAAQDSTEFHKKNRFRTIYVDVSDVDLLEFKMGHKKKLNLLERGRVAATLYFQKIAEQEQQKKAFSRFPKSVQDKIKYDRLKLKEILNDAQSIQWDEKTSHLDLAIRTDQREEYQLDLTDMYGVANVSSQDLENSQEESKHENTSSTFVISCDIENNYLQQDIKLFLNSNHKTNKDKGEIVMPHNFPLVPKPNMSKGDTKASDPKVEEASDDLIPFDNNSNTSNGATGKNAWDKETVKAVATAQRNAHMVKSVANATATLGANVAKEYFGTRANENIAQIQATSAKDIKKIEAKSQLKITQSNEDLEKYRADKVHDSNLATLTAKVQALEEQNKRLAAANEELLEKREASQTGSQQSAKEMGRLEGRADFYQEQLNGLKEEIKELKAEKQELKDENAELKAENRRLQQQLQQLLSQQAGAGRRSAPNLQQHQRFVEEEYEEEYLNPPPQPTNKKSSRTSQQSNGQAAHAHAPAPAPQRNSRVANQARTSHYSAAASAAPQLFTQGSSTARNSAQPSAEEQPEFDENAEPSSPTY